VSSLAAGLAGTALLTAAFAATGEIVLRRRSRTLAAWNESFLAGAAVAAAALFPLSLVLPRTALRVELGLLGIALAVAAMRSLSARPRETVEASSAPDFVSRLLFLGLLAAFACFVALDLRYNLGWDGLLIWASKAQVLFHEGALGRAWYTDDAYELRHLTYPPLVPLFEALLQQLQGRFDFDAVKPVFIPFYVSLLISTFAAVRVAATRRVALAALLMLAVVPALVTGPSAGGYADMPQAAFVAGAVGAAFRRSPDRKALPWILGGMTTVKAEGTILAGLASAAIVGLWIGNREGRPPARSRWSAALVVAGFLFLRFACTRWLAVTDPAYAPFDSVHLREAIRRIPEVARICAVKALSPRRWGLLWPGFGVAGAVLLVRGTKPEKTLAAWTAAAAFAMALPFLMTNWPIALQIDQSYPRLLGQLAPAAVAVLVFGYRRALAEAPTS
jgi:hypothetical protein